MSESVTTGTSVPAGGAAPAAPPLPALTPETGPAIGGPPRDQPSLSVTEAARLLNRQRREASGEPAAPQRPQARQPSPNEAVAAQRAESRANAVTQGQGESRANVAPAGSSAADAMARALGVPVGNAEAPEAAPPTSTGGEIELEGRRYTTSELAALARAGSDYTKKTQALAEQQRAFQAEAQQFRQQAEALAQVLPIIQPEIQRLQQVLQNAPPPDESLIEANPQEYLRQRARWEAVLREQQRLGQLNALQSEAQQRAMARQVEAANQELAKEFPAWGDPRERAQWQQEIVDWALEKGGYARDDLKGLTDARHLRTMMKAMQFDRWVAGAATRAPPTIEGAAVRGTPPPTHAPAQVLQAQSSFDERPSIRSGAALLTARRAGNGSLAR